jgi:hypothetical protein
MAHFLVRSATEQVAEHLRDEMRRGRWVVHLPGQQNDHKKAQGADPLRF